MKYSRPRGTQDIIPPETSRWRFVENAFESTFDRFGYRGIRTPIFEETDLFVRTVGEGTDIISKEMYTFEDRGGRSLTLRPENTASVVRAYLENGMHRWGGIQRLYYFGPMFRYDRPQAGRYRQFHQVGAEAIGSLNPALDVELIQIVIQTFECLGFQKIELKLNTVGSHKTRGPYGDLLLEAIESLSGELTPAALKRYRSNPLRIFDSKDYGASLKGQLPIITEHLPPEELDHFARVKDLLGAAGIQYEEDPFLVRGLDYYTKTVFEVFKEEHGAQSALCGGGRYDDLIEQCGGPATPAIGFSVGIERVISSLPEHSPAVKETGGYIDYYVVCADDSAAARSLSAAQTLRKTGNAEVDLSGRSVKKQLQSAGRKGARVAVVIASDHGDAVVWKDLKKHTEETINDASLAERASSDNVQKGTEG
ncbi:MAG: histidine--tRNA ligase [Candidatus Krumholzibacteria bacterium]|nr:histidine--tRNA ligase [Candidatus Krumholzibacteria bacterium]